MRPQPKDLDQSASLTSLGMNPLMAMQLGKKMRQMIDVGIPMAVYFLVATIHRLAKFV